jgi:hypothetical protein
VVIFQASAPRIFNAAVLIALAEVAGLAEVIASGAAADSAAAVIASAVEDSAAVALADSVAAAGSGADGEDNAWNFPVLFLEKLKPQTNHLKERYEKAINTDKYRQYRRGPGTNIRMPND